MRTGRTRNLLAMAIVFYVIIVGGGIVAKVQGILPEFPGTRPVVPTVTPYVVRPLPTSEPQYETLSLDFSQCIPDRTRYSVAFGSTTIAILGRDGAACRLDYGGEIEDPNWDGKLTRTCRVPARLGVVNFAKKSGGVDLSPIDHYCTDVP